MSDLLDRIRRYETAYKDTGMIGVYDHVLLKELIEAADEIELANSRERKAFEQGAVILAEAANVSFAVTGEIDIEELWQQYRCQDDTDCRVSTKK